MTNSDVAVEALSDFLLSRDWPNSPWERRRVAFEYRTMAAAILNGEAWAIRKAWPEAAYEIQTRDWNAKVTS